MTNTEPKVEELSWEYKEKFNFTKITEQLKEATKQLIIKELSNINSQIDGLHKMGLIKDTPEFLELQNKMKELNNTIQ